LSRFRTRNFEAAQRAADRRKREDDADRLAAVVPALDSLRLDIEERRGGVALPESTHIKRVSVPHAPALFEIPCLDSWCKDGGHDVTHEILQALRSGATEFEGEHGCSGRSGAADCQRVLRYVGVATYKKG
jgi:hypothetical protein